MKIKDSERTTGTGRRRRGRPEQEAEVRRDHRVVTFVTDTEYRQLERLAEREDRSLSFIVHRMIATQLER